MALTGAVVLITGGSEGIGRATALRLAQDGAQLVINYSSNSKAAKDLVQQIGSDRALAFKADASQISGIEELVNATVEKFGRIDIVIPNATLIPMKDLESTCEEDFDSTFALNVKGPYFLVQVSINLSSIHQTNQNQLNIYAESYTAHAPRFAHHLHLHQRMRCVDRHARTSALCIFKRGHRADDARPSKRSGSKGDLGERHSSRSHRHRSICPGNA